MIKYLKITICHMANLPESSPNQLLSQVINRSHWVCLTRAFCPPDRLIPRAPMGTWSPPRMQRLHRFMKVVFKQFSMTPHVNPQECHHIGKSHCFQASTLVCDSKQAVRHNFPIWWRHVKCQITTGLSKFKLQVLFAQNTHTQKNTNMNMCDLRIKDRIRYIMYSSISYLILEQLWPLSSHGSWLTRMRRTPTLQTNQKHINHSGRMWPNTSPKFIRTLYIYIYTSSTARGGGGSFKNRKRIGDWLLWVTDVRAKTLTNWLTTCLSDELTSWLTDWLTDELTNWLTS